MLKNKNIPLLHISSVPGEGCQLIEDHRSVLNWLLWNSCSELISGRFKMHYITIFLIEFFVVSSKDG